MRDSSESQRSPRVVVTSDGSFQKTNSSPRSSSSTVQKLSRILPVPQEKNNVLASSDIIGSKAVSSKRRQDIPILADPAEEKADAKQQKDAMIASSVFSLLKLIIWGVFAVLYKSKVVDSIPVLTPRTADTQGKKDFITGYCECLGSIHVCLHTFCCMQCRTAHTWTVVGALGYWPSIIVQVILPCFLPCIGGCWLRPKVRATLGYEADCFMDFLKWLCCPMCAAGQEAIEVDTEAGIAVACCFKQGPIERSPAQDRPLVIPQPEPASPEPASPEPAP